MLCMCEYMKTEMTVDHVMVGTRAAIVNMSRVREAQCIQHCHNRERTGKNSSHKELLLSLKPRTSVKSTTYVSIGDLNQRRNVHRSLTATVSESGTRRISCGSKLSFCQPRFQMMKRSLPGRIVQRNR